MEILTVGEKQDCRCYVVRINDVRFLVGAPIDFEQVLNYLPHGIDLYGDEERAANKSKKEDKQQNKRFKVIDNNKFLTGEVKYDLSLFSSIDIAAIDYILITKLDNIYALPILTEGFKFEGTILMTQPVHQMGYQMLKEFASMNEIRKQTSSSLDPQNLEQIEELPFVKNIWEDSETLDILEKEGKFINDWAHCFKQEDLDACWEKVKVINFKEEIPVRGGIKIMATASGYHIGSACYSLGYAQEKLMIIDSHSYHRYRHCMPFDYKVLKEHNKILISDSFYASDEVKPKTESESRHTQAELCVNRFVGILKKILKEHKNENIIMPVRNLFFLLDIVDILKEKMSGFRRIHILTSTVEPLMKYSNANVDYLNKILQAKIYQSKPELPFNFDKLAEDNKIHMFDDIHQLVEKLRFKPHYMEDNVPSIFIVVDSTFRLGYSGKMFDIFNNELNGGTVVFTDPYICHSKIFEPLYHTNKLRIINFPLNLNDSLVSTVNLIKKDTADCKIIVPEKYFKLIRASPIGDRLVALKDNSSLEYEINNRDQIYAKHQVYASLKPKSLEGIIPYRMEKPDITLEPFFGSLTAANNRLTLSVNEPKNNETLAVMIEDKNKRAAENFMDKFYELAKKLQDTGMQVSNVEKRLDDANTYVIRCSTAMIRHSPYSTEIFTDSDSDYNTIVKCMRSVLGVYAFC